MSVIHICLLLISLAACTIGTICGIGGGIIIKPSLDLLGAMNTAEVSFISNCTVLCMSAYSVIKSRLEGRSRIDLKSGTPLALGAAVGGIAGKYLFRLVWNLSAKNTACLVQAALLCLLTVGVLVFTLKKDAVHPMRIKNPLIISVVGMLLGLLSSFLGIGGGPFNIAVLFFFFSMSPKTAAENSLYVILFSQAASVISGAATGSNPSVPWSMLAFSAA